MKYVDDNVLCFPDTEIYEVEETTAEWYYDMKGAVPPIWCSRLHCFLADEVFFVGEMYSHIERNHNYVPTYRMMLKSGNRYFSAILPADFTSTEYLSVVNAIAAEIQK